MAIDYSEIVAPEGDTRGDVLELLMEGDAFVVIRVRFDGDSMALKMETGGGISDNEAIRALLEKTLRALP